jgi:putative NADH-flavin reductase
MKQLLIVGATGALGSAATKHFLKRNYPVRAFVRNKTKAANLEEAGAEVFSGDITNPTSLIERVRMLMLLLHVFMEYWVKEKTVLQILMIKGIKV